MKMPEPTISLHGKTKGGKLSEQKLELYDAEQMKQYGRDLLEAAIDIVENADTPDCGGWTAIGIADDLRKLKETL
jgi:hypothetical protein